MGSCEPYLVCNFSQTGEPSKILIAGFVSLVLIAPLVRRLAIEKLESRKYDGERAREDRG